MAENPTAVQENDLSAPLRIPWEVHDHLLTKGRTCNYISVVTWRADLRWTWHDEKNRTHKRDHGLSFETAQLVFRDPLAASRRDPDSGEERWQTIGLIGHVVVFVVHTWPEPDPETGEEVGRIISARKATSHEWTASYAP